MINIVADMIYADDMPYSLDDGQTLVRAARSAIELCIRSPRFDRGIVEKSIKRFCEPSGVFVTIEHYPTRTLRGRMGFAGPSGPLNRQLVGAAIAAASEDRHFAPLSIQELGEVVIEVSILGKHERIDAAPVRSVFAVLPPGVHRY